MQMRCRGAVVQRFTGDAHVVQRCRGAEARGAELQNWWCAEMQRWWCRGAEMMLSGDAGVSRCVVVQVQRC